MKSFHSLAVPSNTVTPPAVFNSRVVPPVMSSESSSAAEGVVMGSSSRLGRMGLKENSRHKTPPSTGSFQSKPAGMVRSCPAKVTPLAGRSSASVE